MTRDEFQAKYDKPKYVGDGVYARFDGYQIWLHLEGDCSDRGIALEPSTFDGLLNYQKSMIEDVKAITNV